MVYYYPHPEMFEDFEKPNFEEFSGKLVLWGAGKIGGVAEHCLRERGIEICAFCDIAKDKWGTEFCGHKVISPEQLKEQYPNAPILITTARHNTAYEEIEKKGFQKIFDCTSLFLKIDFTNYDFWMLPNYALRNVEQYMAAVYEQTKKGNSIDQIFLNITTKCTLRCRHCSMFIPYVTNPCSYAAEDIMKDLFDVLKCVEHIRIVNFYGGEPLLHPELYKMVSQLAEETRIDRISIITNGTIVPDEQLLSVLKKDSRIMFRISDYGALSSKLDEVEKVLAENGIAYEVSNYAYWDLPSKIEPFDGTEEDLELKFQQCTACNVLFLLNRKLYLCSAGSAVNNIGAFPPSEDNYVDIRKYADEEAALKEKIVDFIARPRNKRFLDSCRYCSGVHCIHFEDKVPVAEQTKETLEFMKLH